jgi:hypothetical protein
MEEPELGEPRPEFLATVATIAPVVEQPPGTR